MKKRGSVLILSILMVLLSFNFVSATGLALTGTYPEEGYNKVEPKNVMIKLFFNEDMSSESAQTANAKQFALKDPKGTAIPFDVLYDSKDKKKICLVLKEDLASATKYTLSIPSTVQDGSGNMLGTDKQLTFQTRNSASDGTMNMLLMGIMVVVMVFFTMRDAKKTAKAEEELAPEPTAVNLNPYKYAKEKGISVEQAIKEIEELKKKSEKKPKSPSPTNKTQNTAKNNSNKSQQSVSKLPKKHVQKVKTQRRAKYTNK